VVSIGAAPGDGRYASFILQIRNRMRKFSYVSLLEQILLYLNQPVSKKRENELKKLPWVAERLFLWLLADLPSAYRNQVATEKDVQTLVSQAWQQADESIGKEGIGNLDFFMRQYWMNQAAYQTDLSAYNLSLQMHLLRKLDSQTRLHKFFSQRAGMPVNTYFELAMLRWSHTKDKPWVNQKYIDSLLPHYPIETQQTFLNSMTLSLIEAQNLAKERVIRAEEWSQPFFFYKTPCIWHSGASVPIGRPNLRRHFEGILFDWIEQSGEPQMRQHFDKQVETYVGHVLQDSGLEAWGEDRVRSELRLTNKQAVDFLVIDEKYAVLIEVKNKSLTHAVPATRNVHPIRSRLKSTVIDAIPQLDSTEKAIRASQQLKDRGIIRLIITFNDLWIGSAESLPDEERADKSWLVSLQDLSYLLQTAKARSLSIGEVLSQFAAKQADRLTSSLTLGRYLEREFKIGQELPINLRECAESMMDAISEKLKHLK
jgi:hypothetical protein